MLLGQRGSHPTWVRGLKRVAKLILKYNTMSHPTWVRGLKLNVSSKSLKVLVVAPYVGAWIETSQIQADNRLKKSHPTWVRGLKPLAYENGIVNPLSHPTWVRGLKLIKQLHECFYYMSHPTWVRGLKHFQLLFHFHTLKVAPYVGAWIETVFVDDNDVVDSSHPTWVRGLKLSMYNSARFVVKSHPTWVRGLKQERTATSRK